MADKEGFLQALGLPRMNEQAAIQQYRQATAPNYGGSAAGTFANIGHQLGTNMAGGAYALGAGIKGQVTGEGGRGWGAFKEDVTRGSREAGERQAAQAMGVPVEDYKRQKDLRQKIERVEFDPNGSYEARIAAVNKMAKLANESGDVEVAMRASQYVSKIKAQQRAEIAEGLETDMTREQLKNYREEDEFGIDARRVTSDPKAGYGKAVRIDEGPDTGKYRFLDHNTNEVVVVDPIELARRKDDEAKKSAAGTPKWRTLAGVASDQGASSARIGAMRTEMTNMGKQAQIMTNLTGNLNSLSDPQSVMSVAGKTAIAADQTVSFVESFSSMMTGPSSGKTKIPAEWNGKKVPAAEQYRQIQKLAEPESGFLVSAFKKMGGTSSDLNDYLPPNIRGNALAAEQYWANVMSMAFMDARLEEPENPRLTNADIEHALTRLGASTANPVSFATRMLEIIDTKMLPNINSLGMEFTTDPDTGISPEQVRDYVYAPEVVASMREKVLEARAGVLETISRGRRGDETTAQGAPRDSAEARQSLGSFFEPAAGE